ncbi:hypothetical protein K450DRAFT_217979 [Umbelopsis ramanniana AG]|uniref:Uncharacterized protein n=1 Tax=Umbelopsis ramanniana AG TaxID=1314678 RepID=A0AAD5HHP6_UMBRA|nr:uncharacterized protein K450DRAFT_217979 [Umbelopsis ramanniana AG]KAI8584775.1 hypothetical protein K450DRAFT_217979 [Umbelopsis ramanniana AG]
MSTLPITTSEVAGIISASLFFMVTTSSLGFVAILLAVINNKSSANGWSVAGAAIQSSPWPFILRTDASQSLGVQSAINTMSQLALVGTFLMTLTGIVTPLGLQDTTISKPAQNLALSYIKDFGPMGSATAPRTKYKEGRLCSGWPNVACVGSTLQNNNGSYNVFSGINANVTSKFTSPAGTQSSLNMQYRQYSMEIIDGVNTGQPTSVGKLANLQSYITSNSTTAAEGIVVDMTNTPGIGIMQHTFPSDSEGGSWFRDVLWLEPLTECLDTNLTIQYKISSDLTTPVVNSTVLVDKGGLFDLTTKQPDPYTDTITSIDLAHHAYTGAVWGNLAVLRAINITRNASHYGSTYLLKPSPTDNIGYLSFLPINYLAQLASGNLGNATYVSPSYVQSYCQGYDQDSTFTASTRMVHCSLLLGTPRSVDGSSNSILLENKVFEQPVYSCASTVQASIQQLNVTMNQQTAGTSPYSGLQVSRQSTNTSILWGIESTAMNVSSTNAYWGPVSDDYENDTHLFTQRSEAFLLPAGKSDFPIMMFGSATIDPVDTQGSSIPGLMFTLMENLWMTRLSSTMNKFDFSGKGDYGVQTLWQELSQTVDTAPQIVKYVWTNLMASNTIGIGNFTMAEVSSKGTSVTYDIRYAIPAVITLAFWLFFICFSLILLFRRQVTLSEVRNAINQTAIGRAVVNMINPSSHSLAKTEEWVKVDGKSNIGLVLGRTVENENTAKFDYDPEDTSLIKILDSIPHSTLSKGPSHIRVRKPSSSAFSPLNDTDIALPENLKPTYKNRMFKDYKPNAL